MPLRVRIGLHTGEVLRERADFFGKKLDPRRAHRGTGEGERDPRSSLLRDLVDSVQVFSFGDERDIELKGLAGVHRVLSVLWSEAQTGAELAAARQA